mgnify:CR=1 FL=1
MQLQSTQLQCSYSRTPDKRIKSLDVSGHLSYHNIGSLEECKAKCDQINECLSFNWWHQINYCELKTRSINDNTHLTSSDEADIYFKGSCHYVTDTTELDK